MRFFLAMVFVILPVAMGWAQSCVPPNDTPIDI